MKINVVTLGLLMATPISPQDFGTPLSVASEYTIPSSVLSDDRPIVVALPDGYDPDAAYPVIYVLDAQWHFLHAVASSRFLADNAGRMPKAIVVGVHNVGDDRPTSFIPPAAGGGADAFAAFLRDELKPWVEARHRTRPFQVLIGHSLSGLFATHLLNSQPDLFSGYIAISPSLHSRLTNGAAYVSETNDIFQRIPDLRANWYMTLADEGEPQLGAVRGLVDTFEDGPGSEQFRWTWRHMPSETHESVPARSVYDGLEWMFSGFNPAPLWDDLRENGAAAMPRIDEHFRALSAQMGWQVPPPDAEVAALAARMGGLDGKVDAALEITRILVERSPDDFAVQYYRGLVLGLVCDIDAARVHHDASLDLAREALGEDAPQRLAMIRAVENFRGRVDRGEQCG